MARAFAFLIFAIVIASREAPAGELGGVHPWLERKFSLEVGIFYPERSIKLKARGTIDFDPDPDQFVDLASQFKLSESDRTFAGEFAWRYGRRWSLRMQYFDSKGSQTAVLEEDIEWEDLTFLAGTQATAGTEFELTRFVWDYTLDSSPNFDLGLSAGFHWLHIRGYIEGTVESPSGPSFSADSASVDAPLPNIGLTYIHSLSPRWALRTRFDWFNADIHPYDGLFINASAGFNYLLTDKVNVGINYNYVELDVGVNGDNWRGEIENRYDGAYIYLGATW